MIFIRRAWRALQHIDSQHPPDEEYCNNCPCDVNDPVACCLRFAEVEHDGILARAQTRSCNRLWVLKNSLAELPPKMHRVRMLYKRFSPTSDTFLVTPFGSVFRQIEFFNTHACLQQLRNNRTKEAWRLERLGDNYPSPVVMPPRTKRVGCFSQKANAHAARFVAWVG